MTAEPLSDIPTGLDMLRDAYTSCADPADDLPVVVSLFSGIEGIGAGLALSGFKVVVAVECDPECQRVIRARFPDCVIYSDIREVDVDELRKIVDGRRCIVVGGFPCQDVSVAGGRAGVDGTRSGLYVELVRIADGLDPDWLVVENVAGLLSADLDPDVNGGTGWGPGTAMAVVLRDITGFAPPVPGKGWRNSGICMGPKRSAAWRVLDARHTGVAQRRRRVFIVASPRDRVAPAAVLLESEGVRGNPPPGEPPRPRTSSRVAPAAVRAGAAAADGAGGDSAPPRVLADEGVISALTSSLGAGGPDAAHAHAGWMVPTGRDVTAALTAANHDYDRGDTASDSRLLVEESYVPDQAATLTAGVARSEGVNPPGRRQEDDVNLVVEGVGLGADPSVAGTLGTPRDGGDTTGLDGKAAYVVEAQAVAMRGRDVGNVPELDEVMPSLRSSDGGSSRAMCLTGDTTHALTSEGADASEDGTGRGTPIIAVPVELKNATRSSGATGVGTPGTGIGEDGDPSGTVGTTAPPAVATFAKRKRAQTDTDDESWAEGDVAPTLNVNDVGDTRATVTIVEPEAFALEPETGQGADLRARATDLSPAVTVTDHAKQTDRGVRVTTDAAVRRLTPVECERLQGFPDPWLQGLGLSDSAMYRQLGNAVCVAVSGWVGWRLAAWIRGWRPSAVTSTRVVSDDAPREDTHDSAGRPG